MSTDVPGINSAAVAAWLTTLEINVRTPVSFSRIGAGHSNLTYLAQDAVGSRWVLRRPPIGDVLASAHDVAREYRILSALQETSVPTPQIYGLCTDPLVTDAPLMAMEYIDARVISDMASAEAVPPTTRREIGLSMAKTLGQIHAVTPASVELDTLASHAPYAQRQLRRWRRQWDLSAQREAPLVSELASRLEQAIPPQQEVSLVHGDFHLLNVMTEPVSGEVVAVLDWELSTLGDPLADVGSTLAYWTEASDDPVIGFAGPTLEGFPSRHELLNMYADSTGRDVEHVKFWYVLGLWKIAIISEGVIRRASDDPRNASAEGQVDLTIVDRLLERADVAAKDLGVW